MLYRPTPDSPPPSSLQYQAHLPLRISQDIINEQVERKGVRCTHLDALRFFAPEARKWNHYGRLSEEGEEEKGYNLDNTLQPSSPLTLTSSSTRLTRNDQLHLEQKGCLHANMDLFKMAVRLQPFISSELLVETLIVALQARTLDVEASPYDVSGYAGIKWSSGNDAVVSDIGGDMRHYNSMDVAADGGLSLVNGMRQLGAVEVETEEGRKIYQKRQLEVMRGGDIVRKKLLHAYNEFLEGVFDVSKEVHIKVMD